MARDSSVAACLLAEAVEDASSAMEWRMHALDGACAEFKWAMCRMAWEHVFELLAVMEADGE